MFVPDRIGTSASRTSGGVGLVASGRTSLHVGQWDSPAARQECPKDERSMSETWLALLRKFQFVQCDCEDVGVCVMGVGSFCGSEVV